tara:strand:- start:2941 stop:3855 length:915 start_codon:yes stop_codon:yes gene_type:complete
MVGILRGTFAGVLKSAVKKAKQKQRAKKALASGKKLSPRTVQQYTFDAGLKRKKTLSKIQRNRLKRGETKSVKAYNIRVKDAEVKLVPFKKQSQVGETFQTHRVRSRKGRMAAGLTKSDRLPSPLPTLERLYKGDIQHGTKKDYGLTRMYLRNRLSDVKKKKKGGIMKRKMYLSGGQAKLDKNKNNKIDAEDFKILRAEKAKGRGMGLQDEKLKPGKVKKAALGALALGFGAKKIFDKIKGKKKSVKMPGMSGIMPGETVADLYKKKMKGMMGGGMMMRPMGYKAGKSVKVKCKLGRNKPTKMY